MKLLIFSFLYLLLIWSKIFFDTPEEATQGVVQKIFYIHVPSAITMYIGYFIGCMASILYLKQRKARWDQLAKSSIEVAYIFTVIVLVTGPLWAKPIWGTYWTWEPRLTTTLLLWFMYSSYLLLQRSGSHPKTKTFAAALAVISFLNVPLVHLSVRLWRGIHPSVLANEDGLPSSMKLALVLSFSSILMIYAALLRLRVDYEKLKQKVEAQT